MNQSRSLLGSNHPRIRVFRRVFENCSKRTELFFPVEGPRMVQEGLQQNSRFVDAIVTPDVARNRHGRQLVMSLRQKGVDVATVEVGVLGDLSDLKTPQGIVALCRKRVWRPEDMQLESERPVVVLCGIQDPGNFGTIVRTSEAAEAAAIISLRGTVSLYNPKVIRSTMGSIFRFPVLEGYTISQLGNLARSASRRLVATVGSGGEDYRGVNYWRRSLLLLGSEAAGIPEELLGQSERKICIPINPNVESLNVAVAAAVLLFWGRHQTRAAAVSPNCSQKFA